MKRKLEEVEFCKKTLEPLFEAMSPHLENIRYRHGSMEFGKDLTFSYVNPLNQRINVGLQAKWGDIKGSSTSLISEIVAQIEVAFKVPYKNKPDGQELYINELYIICSGKYRNNAIEIIEKTLAKNFNVHFLDGSDIKYLQNKVAMQRTKEKTEKKRALNALLIELDQNLATAKEIDSEMGKLIEEKKHFLTSFRLNCLQKILETDVEDKLILKEAASQWAYLNAQNNLLNSIRLASMPPKQSRERKELLWEMTRNSIIRMQAFRKYIASYLDRFE